MWADTLYLAERNHLLRLAAWGAASVLAATLLVLLLAARRTRSPLVQHFAWQAGAWGLVELLLALVAWRGLEYRDLAGFTRLDRFLWLNVGLDAGYVAVGVTLALVGWRLARSLGLVGAGLGVVVQGLALLVLDAYLIGVLNRVAAG
jgi:hypothetical protein